MTTGNWNDAENMLEAIRDYVVYLAPDTVIEAVEDPLNLRTGFRCKVAGTEWWAEIDRAKASRFSLLFSTLEGRTLLAECLTNGASGLYSLLDPSDPK